MGFRRFAVAVSGALVAAGLGSASRVSAAEVFTFRDGLDGYDGTQDTMIWLQNGTPNTTTTDLNNLSYGAWDLLVSRDQSNTRKRYLLSFDVSALSGETVLGATLTLTKPTGPGANTVDRDLFANALAPGNAGWNQGTASSAGAAQAGAATGYWKSYAADTPTAWVDAAGNPVSTTGGAFGDAVEDARLVAAWTQTDAAGTQYTLTLSPQLVQSWVDAPAQNAGLLVQNSGGSGIDVILASSEHATAEWRPTLAVTVVPEPAGAALLASLGGLAAARRRRRTLP